MAWPTKVYVATKTLGVYYTSNFNGVDPPTWATANTGLPTTDVRQFALDPADQEGSQYCLLEASRTLYRRQSGTWTAILDTAAAQAVVGAAVGFVRWFYCDPSVPGRLWASFSSETTDNQNAFALLYSDDYGVTWGARGVRAASPTNYGVYIYNVVAYGDNVATVWARQSGWVISYSTNKGVLFNTYSMYAAEVRSLALDPLLPDRVLFYDQSYNKFYQLTFAGVRTQLPGGVAFSDPDALWFSRATATHQRIATVTGIRTGKIYVTTDLWQTVNAPSNADYQTVAFAPWSGDDEDQMIVGLTMWAGTGDHQHHVIGVLTGEADVTVIGMSGTNHDTSPYTDAIPATCGGLSYDGIWAIEAIPTEQPFPPDGDTITPPGGTPITLGGTGNVQAVTMPGYTGDDRGEPLPGDRGAWDTSTEARGALHAGDIAHERSRYHLPYWSSIVGGAPVWTGEFWDSVDIITAAELADTDAADLTSGAATDGQVLTADGAAGAAWESLPALADHAHAGVAGDGGKLDWDNVWTDAAHDHSAAGEGGTFDAANLTAGASTDGQVLTSDGAGGAAWEAIPVSTSLPEANIGDVTAGDYVGINNDGEITLYGNARVENDIQIPLSAFGKGAAAPASGILGSYAYYEFTVNDLAYYCFEVPYDWDESSDLDIELHWFIDEAYATGSGEVQWQLGYTCTKEDATEAVDVAATTVESGDINIPATAKYLTQTELAIPAAALAHHDVVGLIVKRIAATDGNSPAAKPRLVGALIEYAANKLGAALSSVGQLLAETGDDLVLETGDHMLGENI